MPTSFTKSNIYLAVLFSLSNTHAIANEDANQNNQQVEVITIEAPSQKDTKAQALAIGSLSSPDLASWLQSVPGANINRNGPVTGIAQYRGLYGDRVAVAVDGHTLIGAGPNAMDTPLSYVTPLIVESMSMYRGITPVSAGVDTFAGSIDINMRKAQVSNSDNFSLDGQALVGYQQLNQGKTYAAWVNASKNNHGIMVFLNSQNADDYQDGNGADVLPTRFDKQQAGFDYRYAWDNSHIGISYHDTDTKDSGTPALPMDIEFIKGKRTNIDGVLTFDNWQATFMLGHLDAKHGMDNFSMRHKDDPSTYRHNYATADSTDFKLHIEQNTTSDQKWLFGIDGYTATHDATITNPNNAMFNVANFNNIKDERIGAFAQYSALLASTYYSAGLRVKQVNSDAGEVSHHMAGMNMAVSNLVEQFNQAQRDSSEVLIDFALNAQRQYNDNIKIYSGIGIKQQAPSYQQRYLWVPMEATGGLADGKTYIGRPDLDAETAYQLDVGVNYHNDNFYFAPHIYYQHIDDYIQGETILTPSIKMVANMMMGDPSPLKFANLDAKIYGMDVRWYYQVNQNWQLSGSANYVSGKRAETDENLYRIAPLNAQIALNYSGDNFSTQLSVTAYDKQTKVSLANNEQTTKGYSLLDWSINYHVNDDITLRAGVNNLLDKQYVSHLGGYYRSASTMNMGNGMDMDNDMGMDMNNEDMNMAEDARLRVPGQGRNAFIELDYAF